MKCAIYNGVLSFLPNNRIPKGWQEINISKFNDYRELAEGYANHKYIVKNFELVLNPNYEKEQKEKEEERIALLSLTKREVFLALYKADGTTPDSLRAKISDPEALIEFDYAEKYYRGNPLINQIGALLGYTPEDLDYLFINKELPSKTPEPDEPVEVPTEPDEPTGEEE